MESYQVEPMPLYEEIVNFVVLDRDAAIATVSAIVEGQLVIATGSSRRSPEDKPDKRVAVLLAYGRAHESLGNKLNRRARGYVEHNDNIAKQRPEQIEKSVKWHEEHKGEIKKAAKKLLKKQRKQGKAKAKNSNKTIKAPTVEIVQSRVSGAKRTRAADCV